MGLPAQLLRTEGAPLENGKFYRFPAIVVLATLVFVVAWVEGCGGLLGSGSGGNFSLTGTVVDSSTKNPVSGALVVLEQPDNAGIDRVVASTVSASDGTFGFKPSAAGTYDVVADATVTPTSGTAATYAATVTFGVPAAASLNQMPLELEFGSGTSSRNPVPLSNRVTSSGTPGNPVPVNVTLSALQSASIGSITQITIPVFAGSTSSITTVANPSSCPTGTACATYTLQVPSGNFTFGIFNASGFQYNPPTQQSPAAYTVEGKAFFQNSMSPTCTPSIVSSTIVITNGTPSAADLAFTGCF